MVNLIIPGRLPGLNEYTKACRTSAYVGAELKKKSEKLVTNCILAQIQTVRISSPVEIRFVWYEKDKRRDPDNISGFGHKVILDALVKNKILKDDSQRYVRRIQDLFETDAVNPRIEVSLQMIR